MKIRVEIAGRLRELELVPNGATGVYQARLDGVEMALDARLLRPGVLSLSVDGQTCRCVLEETPETAAVLLDGERFAYRVDDPRSLRTRRGRGEGTDGPQPVKAPMPGRVVRVLTETGAAVEAHQGIVVIEAMKMQNELKAPRAGTIAGLKVRPGDTVAAGEVLAVVE